MKTIRPLLAALACAALVHPAFAEKTKKFTEAEIKAAETAERDTIAAVEAAEANRKAAENAAAKLDVGSPAPALKPAKWIQGEPVTAFEKDKTYIIECWATWCGPCVAAIPHVNALHSKFKDKGLVVIGMNVWEEGADKAEAFVKKKGDGMAYRVAYDGGKSGDIAKTWLKAAGADGIPHAFVVRENKILWQGHPGDLTEETVAEMIAGKFDAAKAAEETKLQGEFDGLTEKFEQLIEEKKIAEASKILARQVAIAAKIMPAQAALVKKAGAIEITLAKGDIKTAIPLIREFAGEGAKVKEDKGETQFKVASWLLTDERLTGTRDYPLALACLDRLIVADPDAAKSSLIQLFRARALDGSDKKDEAVKCLEPLAVRADQEEIHNEAKAALAALKAGKPWPKGDMNPDGKDAPADAKPAAVDASKNEGM